MELFRSRIETVEKGAVNTNSDLTILPSVEAVMAKASLPKSNSKIKICSVANCFGKVVSRELCGKHRMRVHRTGTTDIKKERVFGTGETLRERFYSRVLLTPTGCMEWQGCRDWDGYGIITHHRVSYRAHCFSLFLETGAMPKLWVLHSCDNPPCVNPQHLREGTYIDNAADRVARGRSPKGEKNPNAKLNAWQVRVIRRLLQAGHRRPFLSALFDVTRRTIGNIELNYNWND